MGCLLSWRDSNNLRIQALRKRQVTGCATVCSYQVTKSTMMTALTQRNHHHCGIGGCNETENLNTHTNPHADIGPEINLCPTPRMIQNSTDTLPLGDSDEEVSGSAIPPRSPKSCSELPNLPCFTRSPQPIKRHRSLPSPNRRFIFGQFWEKNECDEEVPFSKVRPTTDVSATSSTSTNPQGAGRPVATINNFDIRCLAPPAHRRVQSEYFRDIHELSPHSKQSLPRLPAPLMRFYHQGTRTSLNGMYPMNTPRSILRESSYRRLITSNHDTSPRNQAAFVDMGHRNGSFNLTRTLRQFPLSKSEQEDCSLHSDTASTSISQDCTSKKVQFDPRVVVTEFEDNIPREWFNEQELERFQCDTIMLARRYLLNHPELIPEYSRPKLDPVTCTLRKKALFSMPILSSDDDLLPRSPPVPGIVKTSRWHEVADR